ncbi:DUF1667 domain-containing protein [Caloramator sp. E03]|uniref:DUF1667 domain-containing protein n=1 Tax=Caloramator sp. E03 TaxID=2576307 RepID=UPI001110A4AD|nr:DUF1667 domain-containing protein [Caloramator sp. E03]QCX33336.1 DUF1667 domain-containing protein [Caloramator sp. E03]
MIKKIICINCPLGCEMEVLKDDGIIKVSGNTCKKGEDYAIAEIMDPKRIVTTTAKVIGGDREVVPVKTDKEISKSFMFDVVAEVNRHIFSAPLYVGQVLIENIFDTGVNVIATDFINRK